MLIKLLVASLVGLMVLFIALLWLVADLMHISLLLPAAATAFVVLVAVSILLYRKWRASGAAQGLERELAAQAKEQAKLVRPDLQAEVHSMQGEFDKAVSALKGAKLGPGGNNALYFLPWYAIIGPPGAGKSTALRNSGLNFPYTSGTGGPSVKGLGGTRNCDWWLSNEAVMLDTAGRWSTEEEDRDEWLSFLGLLKRYRPRKPLNGLIAAISIGDVVNAREDEVEALATRMRARLDEVQTQLRVSIPVYVLFTKADLVEGFLETFGDLRKGDRNQVWGFTQPLSENVTDIGSVFNTRFEELAGVLEKRSLARMADDRSIPRRARIYAFPQQFMALRRNLQRFLDVMFQHNVYQATPKLRGCYFTSGTQEGRPFNLLVNRLVEALGVNRTVEVSSEDAAVDQKSYFLHDLFMSVIFEDRDVASASDAELRRQRRGRWVLTGVLGAVSLVIGLIPGYAWSLNKYLLTRIEGAVNEWEAPDRQQLDQPHKLEKLEPLRERVDALLAYEKNGVPLSMTMGMYQADQLVNPLRRYYANLLRRELVQPLLSQDLHRLADFSLRYAALAKAKPKEAEQAEFYELLKLHLLLTQPKQRGEPPLQGPIAEWVNEALLTRWSVDAQPEQQESAKLNAGLYVSFMTEWPELTFSRDAEVVKRVRAVLNRVSTTQRALNHLIAVAEQNNYALTLPQLVGTTTAFHEAGKVRSAFTRRGWENIVRDALTPQLLEDAGELWVLGLADDAEQEKQQREVQLAELRTRYFNSYIEEWQAFLRSVRTNTASNNAASLELLRELTRGVPGPQALLIQKAHYNLQLKPKPTPEGLAEAAVEGTVGKLKDRLNKWLSPEQQKAAKKKLVSTVASSSERIDQRTESDVAKAFEGYTSFAVPPDTGDDGTPKPAVPFAVYKEQIEFVRDALQIYLDNPSQSDQLQSRLQQARARVRSLIEQQQTGFRPYFESLLWPPISGASNSTTGEIAQRGSDSWCNDVVAEYARSLAGHYPFSRDGQDLALTDFSNFYRPKVGRLWSFVDSRLAATVELDGDSYTFARALGQDGSRVYSRDLLEFLNRSRDIMRSYFPSGANEPSIEFEVRVHPSPEVAMTQFNVGGKSVEHYNGPEQWKSLVWPGADPAAGSSIVIRGSNGMHERIKQDGPWGLMRLLEAGSLMPDAGRTFTVAWQLQTHDVTLKIDFRPKRSESPFLGVPGRSSQPTLLQPVRNRAVAVPKHIALSGTACKT